VLVILPNFGIARDGKTVVVETSKPRPPNWFY